MVACIIFKFDPVYISDHEFNKLKKNKSIKSKKVLENAVAVTV
jgi:hypothetical protein